MIANIENQKAKEVIKRKIIGSARSRNRQTHSQATMIRPTKVIIKARYAIKEELPEKETAPYQIMRKINGNVADDSV